MDMTRKPTERELSADFYRVCAAVVIVIGHWLAASVYFRDGQFGNDDVLADLPWTQWLTLIFQVVPVFFVVAGYANAASWACARGADDVAWYGWLRQRVTRTLGPTTVYVAAVLAVIAALVVSGVSPSQVAFGGWAVALHLWFIPIYLIVVALTPIAVAAQQRWGLTAVAVPAAAVAAVDAASFAGWLPHLGAVNYLLCWAAVFQIGVAWHGGALQRRRPLVLFASAAVALALLVGPGPYPVSMVGVTGAAVKNTTPPTIAMVVFAVAQAGLVIAVAPAISRWLRHSRLRAPVAIANRNVMMLYLWHMVPVVIVSLIAYPTGLLHQPPLGSGGWWLARLAWLAVLVVVTAAELTLLWFGRSWFAAPLRTVPVALPRRFAAPALLLGAVAATIGLSRLAANGFTSDGRFPVLLVLLFVAGVALVALQPVGARRSVRTVAHPSVGPSLRGQRSL
ncbi:acyltransferase family protein [Mycobacterium sp. NPDC050551]|uniref:acyltransferase family protein n=1 Tax=Mycobacterium sp. NPDC050551 TaxID=3155407 RepID=UPI003439108C